MDYNIVLLPGDGIGPALIYGAIAVLNAVERKFGHNFHMTEMPFGGSAIDLTGIPLPDDTLEACKAADGVLVGAVGGEKWRSSQTHNRPERALNALHSALGLYAGLYHTATGSVCSPLKTADAKRGINIMLVKDLLGGPNNGEHGYRDGVLGQEAFDSKVYAISEVERIAGVAFELAKSRSRVVTDVTENDILSTSRLWRATVERVAKNYPTVTLKHEDVTTFATNVMLAPHMYDVVLSSYSTGNIMDGILSGVVGSAGLLASGAIGGGTTTGVYGYPQRVAENPVGTILSAAMLLSSLNLQAEATAVNNAVKKTLAHGMRTVDVAGGKKYVDCARLAEEIAFAVINS